MLLRVRRLGPKSHMAAITTSGGLAARCAIGRSGIVSRKREGDGATPRGLFSLRCAFYRPDRLPAPLTALPVYPIGKTDGWCDAPDRPEYNQGVQIPFGSSHERLWRTDRLYDIIVALSHNDEPVVSGLGSAIFMHLASPGFCPTEGCIAVTRPVMLSLLARATRETTIVIG